MKKRIAIMLVIVMGVMTMGVFAADPNRKLIIDSAFGTKVADPNEKDLVLTIKEPAYMIDMVGGAGRGAAKGGGVGALILASQGSKESNSTEILINAASFKHITDGASNSEIYQFGLDFPLGAMRFIDRKEISSLGKGDFRYKIQKQNNKLLDGAAKSIIGNRPIVNINISVNNKPIDRLKGGIQVEIPYKAPAGEDLNKLALYRVDENGKLSQVKNSRYTQIRKSDGDKPYVQAIINEVGKYAVGYEKTAYKDVTGWYEPTANFVLARGIMNDIKGLFMPKDSITRADLAFYLSNMSDQNSKASSNNFSDVSKDHPYAKSIDWAYSTGLIKGYEDGTFKPNQVITRQELAVMLNRYTQIIAKSYMPMINKKVNFKDDNKISPYGKEAVSYLQQAGVIGGRGNGYFDPLDNVTRAECAKMITIVMNGIMDGKTKFVPIK